MRIRTLSVRSILHYDALDLDFGGGNGALHILYGPNEAGKSTLLKLFLDLLFGGTMTGDHRDFYDSRSQLEGTIEDALHAAARVGRKKSRNRLLLDSATDLSEAELTHALGGYDRERFGLLFGFDHQKLQTGGESLLVSGGETGVSLFEAGGGIGHLQNLLEKLGAEAADLLDPSFRGNSAKRLNRAWRSYQDANKAVRSSGLRSDAWHRQRDEIASLFAQTQQLQAKLQEKQRERTRLERLNRAGKFVSGVEATRQQLAALGNVTKLTRETEADIRAQLSQRNRLADERRALDVEYRRLVSQRDQIAPDEFALEYTHTMIVLNEGLQAYVSRKTEDLPALVAQLERQQSEVTHQLYRLAPDRAVEDIDALAIPLAEQTRIDQLIKTLTDSKLEVQTEQQRVQEKTYEVAGLDGDLQQLGDVPRWQELAQVLQTVRSRGQTAAAQVQFAQDIAQRKQELYRLFAAQTLWAGPVETADALPVPLTETVANYAAQWAEAVQRLRDCEQAGARAREEGEAAQRELETLELGGRVPVEADLAWARARRDAGWALVKRSWLGADVSGPEVTSYRGDGTLDEAFEAAMLQSDETADWMRKEADGSARRALLMLREQQVQRTAQSQEQRYTQLTAAFEQLATQWKAVWAPCGIEPGTPAEMRDFMANVHRPLADGLRALRELDERQMTLAQARATDHTALSQAAAEAGVKVSECDSLETLIDRCAQHVETAGELQHAKQSLLSRRIDCERQLSVQRDRLNDAQTRQTQYLTQWQALRTHDLHLPEWDVAGAYLQSLNKLFDEIHAAKQTKREMLVKQAASTAFEEQADALAAVLNDPVEVFSDLPSWVRHMRERLSRAQKAASDLERIDGELSELAVTRTAQTATTLACDTRLDVWMRAYDCADAADLGQLVEVSEAVRDAESLYNERVEALRNAGDGASAEQLEQAYKEIPDIDALPGQIEALTRDIDDGQAELDEVKGALRERQVAFEQQDGSQTQAADYAQEAEQHLAEVDRSWRLYLRTALAEQLLRRAIEAFRERNESSVLAQASDIFRRLTLEQYVRLGVEQDTSHTYLEAVRADGSKRRVSQLSDGTRDQLYLSLRLAFVAHHTQGAEPLPLIMDDILVHFDDARTAATLEVLHELSANTQILYFTHHQSVVEAATRLSDASRVQLHPLGGSVHSTGHRESAATLASQSGEFPLF